MKNLFLASALASTILVGAASAASIETDVPNDIQTPSTPLTRAAVLADLQVWRLSGLQDLNRGESAPDLNRDEYKRALATYQYLRSSPQFDMLVQRLQENPNATVLARRTSGTLVLSSN